IFFFLARSKYPKSPETSKPQSPDAVALDSKDNVATSLRPLSSGSDIQISSSEGDIKMQVIEDIPPGHKLALSNIKSGEHVMKFGEVIGVATKDIRKGTHVHIHNLG